MTDPAHSSLSSCGFDASEYESPSMNRHGCKVPTSFYHRFTRDVCKFAETFASGRVVSVMEGGYDDKAIISGAMSHVCGLADTGEVAVDPIWWENYRLTQVSTNPHVTTDGVMTHSFHSWKGK